MSYVRAFIIVNENGPVFCTLSRDVERVRSQLREGETLRAVKMNYLNDNNSWDYKGYVFKDSENKMLVSSFRLTQQECRLAGGEGTVYPARIIFLDHQP